MIQQIERLICNKMAPLKRKVLLMLSRGIVARVDDSGGIQRFQGKLLAGEVLDDIEVFQNYGFSSRAPRGSEFIMASVGGNREHAIAIATMNRNIRVKELKDGESVIYNSAGDYVYVKEGGEIEVKASSKVLVDSPEAEFTGNVLIKGNLTVEQNATIQGTSTQQGAITAGATISATGNITTQAGVTATGPVAGAGVTDTLLGVSISAIRSTFNTHTHTEQTGSGTAPTSAPNQTI